MPIPSMTGLPPFAQFQDLVSKMNTLVQEYNNLLVSLDTLNIIELDAEVIIAGSIEAGKLAVDSVAAENIQAGAIITEKLDALAVTAEKIAALAITTAKLAAGAVTADKITVSQLSAIAADLGAITAGIITGATIRTAASGKRIELSGNDMKTYNASDNLNGIVWGSEVSGTAYGDILLYDNGTITAKIMNTPGVGWQIFGMNGKSIILGLGGTVVEGDGDWEFSGSVQLPGAGVVTGGQSQSDSTATTVDELKDDFNDLLFNLQTMGILG